MHEKTTPSSPFDRSFTEDIAVEESSPTFCRQSDVDGCALSLSAPGIFPAVTELRERIMAFISTPALSIQELSDLELAVGEACTNAMRHGSPRGDLDEVCVRCVKEPHRLVVEICDRGYGFNPDAVPPPSPEALKESGMGIFLMRTCVDKVEFEFGPGTTVRLIKYCRPN